MGWFWNKQVYDRSSTLEKAAKAQGRGNKKKAVVEYKKVLEHEPENPSILAKVAALLAETKQPKEAWDAFVKAAEIYKKQGFDEKALAVYVTATSYMPNEVELWETVAKMHVKRGRPADAVKACLDGRRNFRKRKHREYAIRLLALATRIEPWEFESTFDLAGLRRADGDKREARRLLEGLVPRSSKWRLRKVRGALFRLSPTPAAAWRWMRAAIAGR